MKPKVIKVKDKQDLIPTCKYPHAKFPFEHFNPVQSRVFENYSRDANYIVAAPTSCGKTVCAELFLAHEVRELKGKGMYLAPLRALAQEKIDDWTDESYHLGKMNVSICTGDYRLTANRKKEIDESDLIIMTSEMLNSRCRNYKSENNEFLRDIGTLVVDESHLLTVKGRGDHLESGIMKFTQINPNARLIFTSATMPNVDEIGDWLTSLTKKDTIVLESEYRPCPLHIHYQKYWETPFSYEENELSKIRTAIDIVEKYPSDKFLLFVHTKRTGEELYERLKKRGVICEYHNADLTKEKRVEIEKKFKANGGLRCIVATSTLAWGCNLPARRVVVLGVHRGISLVENYDIAQMVGRAGRPQFDPQGDAYILLPSKSFDKCKAELEEPKRIVSQFSDGKCLAFHITSEVHHRNIQSDDDIEGWYERSLAHHQSDHFDEEVVGEVMNNLTRCGAMVKQDGMYETTTVGNVSSMFYFSPFDISDLARNWKKLFDYEKDTNDYWIAMALANVDSLRGGIASNAEKEESSKFKTGLNQTNCPQVLAGSRDFTDAAIKYGCAYHNLITGKNSAVLGATMRGMQMDFERVREVLNAIDSMSGKWGKRDFFRRLGLRVMYGVPEELVDLCQLKGIGKIKAKRLWDGNLKTVENVANNVLGIIKSLNCSKKVAEGVSENAKELLRGNK